MDQSKLDLFDYIASQYVKIVYHHDKEPDIFDFTLFLEVKYEDTEKSIRRGYLDRSYHDNFLLYLNWIYDSLERDDYIDAIRLIDELITVPNLTDPNNLFWHAHISPENQQYLIGLIGQLSISYNFDI